LRAPERAGLARRIGEAATTALAKARGLKGVALQEALDPDVRAIESDEMAAATLAIERGKAAFDDLDLDGATRELELGIRTLVTLWDRLDPRSRGALESGIFCLGAVSLFEGAPDAADGIFVRSRA
jgi:hypothetical protein